MRLHAGMSIRVVAAIVVALMGLLGLAAARAGAAPMTEFKLPAGDSVGSLIDGPDGALWFGDETSANVPELGRITTAGAITTKAVAPAGNIGDLAVGANGTIWFTMIGTVSQAIGERTASGQIKIITPGMDGLNPGAAPVELAEGNNGVVWFLDHGSTDAIGEITASGSIVEYPTGGLDPDELTTAPNGDGWFTVFGPPGWVGFAVPGKTAGTPATLYPVGAMRSPAGITAAGNGNMWFSDQATPAAIGRSTPSGTITEFGEADGLQMNAEPDALTPAPDGNIWFDDQYGTKPAVGRVTPTGAVKEYPLKHEGWDLTVGIDGNIWLPTGDNGGANPGIARVIPATGKIEFFSAGLLPTAVIEDGTGIVSGPDGNLWMNDKGSPQAIVRADVQLPPTATTGTNSSVTNTSAHVAGTVNPRGAATTAAVQFGTSPSLGSTAKAGSLAEADAASPVSATLTGLPPGTKIYYRVSATNAYGTVTGTTQSFTTTGSKQHPPPPAAGTRTVRATFGNQQITLTLPSTRACLSRSARLRLKVGSVAIAKSKAARLRFQHLAVFIDRGVKRTHVKVVTKHHHKHRVRIIVHVPNARANHLPATLKPSLRRLKSGSHTLRLRLTYGRTRHVGHHTVHSTVTKTLKLRFKVC